MNGMVRRFIPKGRSLRDIPQIYLDDIAFAINYMPKKIFDFKSTFEIELDYEKWCG